MSRWLRPAPSVATLAVASVLTLSTTALAQEAAPQAAPQPAAPAAMTLDSGAGIFFHMIKPDRTADFEWVMGRIREALAKSEDASRKQQATGLSVLKSTDAVPNSPNVMYVVMVNPSVKGADYSMQGLLKMLYEAFPAEQQDIYKRVSGAFGGPTNRVNLQPVQ